MSKHGRLIDANALMAEMHNIILEDGEDRRTFYEVIERQPTIEPERKRGKWETCFDCPYANGCPYISSVIPDDCPLSVEPERKTGNQLPSAQPYSEADIQKMQDLEQAELQKAYECGRASAQQERETGEWSVEFSPAYKGGAYCECSQCNYKFAMGAYFEPDEWKFCPNCGADMRGETE